MNFDTSVSLKGVNLGGWLVLERWMTPGFFEGTDAEDEYSFMQTPDAAKKIEQHRRTFIQETDFQWLSENGINAVRIPVGYWIFKGDGSYTPCIERLDWAMKIAEKYSINVLIDLHGAKGSQNGQHHSGKAGKSQWFKDKKYRIQTITTLKQLAERYHDSPALWGIELLNEPKFGLFHFTLRKFYKDAQRELEKVIRPGVAIVFHDAFTPRLLSGALKDNRNSSVIMDVHWYQFSDIFRKWRSLKQYFSLLERRSKLIKSLQKKQPIIVGEWSVTISGDKLQQCNEAEEWRVFEKHGRVQLELYAQTAGWFYWTYKTDGRGIWNFRSLIEDGHLSLVEQSDATLVG